MVRGLEYELSRNTPGKMSKNGMSMCIYVLRAFRENPK